MTNYLKGLKAFSVDYDTDHEIVDKAGQKIQYSASGSITASRGDGFRMTRKGPYADVEVTFDGKLISLHGKGMNVYAQIESPGPSIDEAVEEFRMSTGLDAAGADLLSADPYARPHRGRHVRERWSEKPMSAASNAIIWRSATMPSTGRSGCRRASSRCRSNMSSPPNG